MIVLKLLFLSSLVLQGMFTAVAPSFVTIGCTCIIFAVCYMVLELEQ